MKYITRDGDMLDDICWVHYGDEHMIVAVMDANPGLVDRGIVLTAGIEIELPDLVESKTPSVSAESIWD